MGEGCWGREKKVAGIKELVTKDKEKTPQWYVNGQGQTMVVIPGPVEFLMGSPSRRKDRGFEETPHVEWSDVCVGRYAGNEGAVLAFHAEVYAQRDETLSRTDVPIGEWFGTKWRRTATGWSKQEDRQGRVVL